MQKPIYFDYLATTPVDPREPLRVGAGVLAELQGREDRISVADRVVVAAQDQDRRKINRTAVDIPNLICPKKTGRFIWECFSVPGPFIS